MGLIKKMYGQNVMFEELNKLMSESLTSYIRDEKLDLLGEPLVSEKQKENNIDTDNEYNFIFDIGLKPKVELNLDKGIELTQYDIEVSEKSINDYVENYANQNGKVEQCEEVIETAFIKADIAEADKEGKVIEGGASAENSPISIKHIKDEDTKKAFIGAKVGDEKLLEIANIMSGEAEIASTLNIEKEEVAGLSKKFLFTIREISNFVKHEVNEELFKKVFPDEEIKTEEEFRNKAKEILEDYKKQDSEYKLLIDVRDYLTNNIELALPEEFLKRWLQQKNADKENFEEQLEKEFPNILKHFKWQLILGKVIEEKEIKVEREEIEELAREQLKMQLMQYGMPLESLKDEDVKQYANDMILSKEAEVNKLYDQKYEDKALIAVKEMAKIKHETITEEEFMNFFKSDELA